MTLDEEFERKIQAAATLEELAEPLEELLGFGHDVWRDERLMIQKALVDSVRGVRIEINPREHPPPHFHVKGEGFSASFCIQTGSLLEGELRPRQDRLIRWWFERSQPKLVKVWNETRPTDCPVGPITLE